MYNICKCKYTLTLSRSSNYIVIGYEVEYKLKFLLLYIFYKNWYYKIRPWIQLIIIQEDSWIENFNALLW